MTAISAVTLPSNPQLPAANMIPVKPPQPHSPAAAPVATDSDGDNDGSGVNLKA